MVIFYIYRHGKVLWIKEGINKIIIKLKINTAITFQTSMFQNKQKS